MADQENCVRETKKRTAAAICEPREKKKRVVLGDLTNTNTNLSNVVSLPQNKIQKQKMKNIAKPKATAPPPPETGILNDPELCGPFDSELDEYLRETEVDVCGSYSDALLQPVDFISSVVSANVFD